MSFQNCKIKAVGADAKAYHGQTAKRGSPEYVQSSSSIRVFGGCPLRWFDGYEPPASDAKDDGNLFDVRLLTPKAFDSKYAIRPETYVSEGMQCPVCKSVTDSKKCSKCGVPRLPVKVEKDWNSNSEICSTWLQARLEKGIEIVTKGEVELCDESIKRFRKDEVLAAFVDASDTQVHVVGEWHDEKTGLIIPVQCLIDLVPKFMSEFGKCVGDVKRTRNAATIPWQRWAFSAGYFIQGAWNMDMYVAATKEDRNTFCFLLSENYPPWQPARRMLSQDFVDLGRAEYTRLMGNYAACVKHNKWPSYDDNDEAIQGWGLVSPESWMASDAQFKPKFDFTEPDPDAQPESDGELIP